MSSYIPCHRKLCTTFSKSFSSCSSRSALFKMYGVVVPFLNKYQQQQQQQESCNREKKKNKHPTNRIALLDWSNIVEVNLAHDNKKGKTRSIALLDNVQFGEAVAQSVAKAKTAKSESVKKASRNSSAFR
ncbi:hypothetical protein T01_12241 [Trichinella spiralis]|uniref:Uncharacterized protein n=1 Tax=Trichinella spiralis TaxID=6334 RepID=A0A0V1BZE9_TRISP|nr:hypothetical protein T01_12241 [Trichinella spiralis]